MCCKRSKIGSLVDFLSFCFFQIDDVWMPNLNKLFEKADDFVPERPRKARNAWYRGQPDDKELLPKVFRRNVFGKIYDETNIALSFRRRARGVTSPEKVPVFDDYDEWLFLMQHHGLPTRLLDWTSSPLIALYFAVSQRINYRSQKRWDSFNPVVWMLNPHALNWVKGATILRSTGKDDGEESRGQQAEPIGSLTCRGAFNRNKTGAELPIAIWTKSIHVRMHAQNSRFTIFGRRHEPMEQMLKNEKMFELGFLHKIIIDKKKAEDIYYQLQSVGITEGILFPDLDGLARDVATEPISFYEGK